MQINGFLYLSILQLSININLAFSNITSQIRNRMSNIFIWHSENWNLKHHMFNNGAVCPSLTDKMQIKPTCVMDPARPSTRPARS